MKTNLAIFEKYNIRRIYDEETEVWFFSVIDIVGVLTGQVDFKKSKSYCCNPLNKDARTVL
jgi:hypothetical protein